MMMKDCIIISLQYTFDLYNNHWDRPVILYTMNVLITL